MHPQHLHLTPDPYFPSGIRLLVISITDDEMAIAAVPYKSYLTKSNRVLAFDYASIEVSVYSRKGGNKRVRSASVMEVERLRRSLEQVNGTRRVA